MRAAHTEVFTNIGQMALIFQPWSLFVRLAYTIVHAALTLTAAEI